MAGIKYVGVDLETTGLDPNKNHRIIQIGIAFTNPEHENIVRDIRPTGDITIQDEAMKVNGFTLTRIAAAPPTHVVDEQIAAELKDRFVEKGSLTPVGWNVGSFDMHFIRKELPLTAQWFSHRVCDLTGIAMYLYDTCKTEASSNGWRSIKESVQEKVEAKWDTAPQWHDAGYDAYAALLALEIMREMR